MSEQIYPSYLIHYGIEGQKWGVRRFQNEDGTYTHDGLLRRKEQVHFVKEQQKINKKFDKQTEKILKDREKGKEISQKRINKAVELGTKHRALDYISKNPRAYLKQHGLEKGSKAKFGLQLGAGIATVAYGGEGIIAGAIVERKLEKMFMNKWMQRQYGDVLNKCKDLTIKDLKKQGVIKNEDTKNNGLSKAGNMALKYAQTNRNRPLQNKIERENPGTTNKYVNYMKSGGGEMSTGYIREKIKNRR